MRLKHNKEVKTNTKKIQTNLFKDLHSQISVTKMMMMMMVRVCMSSIFIN